MPDALTERDETIRALDEHPVALPLAVALTDIDGFGLLNDAEGRDAGDEVLDRFGQAVHGSLPPGAVVWRIGGDEWLLAFPGSPLENALVFVEELRAHVEQLELGTGDHPITMSAGLAARPPHGTTGEELVRAADAALSRSKREGRNRVGVHVEDKMVMKSNYYPRATLDRLASLARATNRTEASLLREAADKLLAEYAGEI